MILYCLEIVFKLFLIVVLFVVVVNCFERILVSVNFKFYVMLKVLLFFLLVLLVLLLVVVIDFGEFEDNGRNEVVLLELKRFIG